MPADISLSDEPTSKHGNASTPYPCSTMPHPPQDLSWAIDYGYCRTSLDYQKPGNKSGSDDPRCPKDCPHKAPLDVVLEFDKNFKELGAKKAAEVAKSRRISSMEK